ncbi:MAG: S-methyl-5-thioribose-1-phosphate isomerase [Candidatus Thermoplasmatota archaeon]
MPTSIAATAAAIRSMQVRGAAAIGIAAAQALATHVQTLPEARVVAGARKAARTLDAARPTAVTLHNALGQVLAAIQDASPSDRKGAATRAAESIAHDAAVSRQAIAKHGARRIPDGAVVLTHCHSSTAVAILARAQSDGKAVEVIATETRPFRQGLRTVRDLHEAGLRVSLIVDSAVAHTLATRDIDLVLVGADTVARDGSLFNKIGTAGVAALAHARDVPFLSAAAASKFTARAPSKVPVEQRDASEVVSPKEVPRGVRVLNPVFDRTAPDLIASYVTEAGLLKPTQAVRRNRPKVPREEVWG